MPLAWQAELALDRLGDGDPLRASNGVALNDFLTRFEVRSVLQIRLGPEDEPPTGNDFSKRDIAIVPPADMTLRE